MYGVKNGGDLKRKTVSKIIFAENVDVNLSETIILL